VCDGLKKESALKKEPESAKALTSNRVNTQHKKKEKKHG
jgi:hypothetical protein